MEKLKEWKDIIFSKMKEHKKQTVMIAALVLLLVIAGAGTGIYYAYLPGQTADASKETGRIKEKKETTEKSKQKEETQKVEEGNKKEEKKETVTESEEKQNTPSSTDAKESSEQNSSSQKNKQDASKQPTKDTSKQPSKDTSKQPVKDTSKQPAKDTPKQPVKDTPKEPPKQPEKPAHTHSWTAQTKVVQHPATGHNEQVLVKDAWTESIPIYETVAISVCNVCGKEISGETPAEHGKKHALAGEGAGHHTEYIQKQTGTETVNHPAEYTTKWVQDSAAWEETVTTGYKCSCGASK